MNKLLSGGIAGFILGIIITIVIMYQAAPGLMLLEDEVTFSSFDEAVSAFEAKVTEQGWKVPIIHDLQKSMKKAGLDVKPVKVFELCHPGHAGKILEKSDERIVSTLMPCRVAIYEKDDGKIYASRMNSGLMASMMDGIIPEVMDAAAKDTEVILKSILD